MNEHDSEQIAALLSAGGMEPTADRDIADAVVLNTCCLPENPGTRAPAPLEPPPPSVSAREAATPVGRA